MPKEPVFCGPTPRRNLTGELMQDWYTLESSECKEPEFVEYFRKFKFEDMREEWPCMLYASWG